MKTKLLFICKNRVHSYCQLSSGLLNSCQLACNALKMRGIECKCVSVVDNNSIDKEVALYKPTHVIIEALWVVPEKFEVLMKLHPFVTWIVRIHSKIPFLSNEGIAIEWLRKYQEIDQGRSKLIIAANAWQAVDDIETVFNVHCDYLPNIYQNFHKPSRVCKKADGYIDVGCFGAIRPLKNQLIQAFAAIQFANSQDKSLRFHINGTRVERGTEILKNLENLFPIGKHKLVKHDWLDHKDFITLVRQMDIGMQTSYSESFNIVAADFVSCGIPIVVSDDITWMPWYAKADPNCSQSIAAKMKFLYNYGGYGLNRVNKWYLNSWNKSAINAWLWRFRG